MAVKGATLDDIRAVRVPWHKVGLAFGLLFAFVAAGFIVTNTYATLAQQGLEERWAEVVGTSSATEPATGAPVAKLVIPSLGLERIVLEGDSRQNLRRAPGHVPDTSLPGSDGNAVIRGHRLLWSGPFKDINRLNYGAEIHVQTTTGTAVYLVAGVFHQDGPRVDMFEQTSLPYLTLITSDPPFRSDGTLVVRAAMVERDGVAV